MGRHSSGERRRRVEEGVALRTAGTAEDLRLLLSTRRLLLLSAATVVLIFVVYVVVLAAVGRLHDWLLLLVVPAGLAGVSVGALLDRAHSTRSKPTEVTDPADPATPPEPLEESAGGGDPAAEEPEVTQQADDGHLAGSGQDEPEAEA